MKQSSSLYSSNDVIPPFCKRFSSHSMASCLAEELFTKNFSSIELLFWLFKIEIKFLQEHNFLSMSLSLALSIFVGRQLSRWISQCGKDLRLIQIWDLRKLQAPFQIACIFFSISDILPGKCSARLCIEFHVDSSSISDLWRWNRKRFPNLNQCYFFRATKTKKKQKLESLVCYSVPDLEWYLFD